MEPIHAFKLQLNSQIVYARWLLPINFMGYFSSTEVLWRACRNSPIDFALILGNYCGQIEVLEGKQVAKNLEKNRGCS